MTENRTVFLVVRIFNTETIWRSYLNWKQAKIHGTIRFQKKPWVNETFRISMEKSRTLYTPNRQRVPINFLVSIRRRIFFLVHLSFFCPVKMTSDFWNFSPARKFNIYPDDVYPSYLQSEWINLRRLFSWTYYRFSVIFPVCMCIRH